MGESKVKKGVRRVLAQTEVEREVGNRWIEV